MKVLKIKIEKDFKLSLPKDLINELELNVGDEISLRTIDKNIIVEKEASDFSEWMEAYRSANDEYGDVLNKLAE